MKKGLICYYLAILLVLVVVLIAYSSVSDVRADTVVPGVDLPNPVVTQCAMASNAVRPVTVADLCPHADTKSIRNVTVAQRRMIFANYQLTPMSSESCSGPGPSGGKKACYEVDHCCSLELGCTNATSNLWPQRYDGTVWNAHVKDKLEDELHTRICSGAISIKEAQLCISTNWIACYKQTFHITGDHP